MPHADVSKRTNVGKAKKRAVEPRARGSRGVGAAP